jgi:ribonuclease-3
MADSPHALQALERRLGHRFTQPRLLERALTHRSAASDHNERLEFLGDAVLTTAISAMLVQQQPDATEGELTRMRAQLVREESLHRLAVAIDLPAAVRLSDGEARGGGAQRASILADAMEAIFGAVYLDGGFEAASGLIERLFGETVASAHVESSGKDAKTALQEWLQGRKLPVPSYRIVATTGQAHAQVFDVECAVAVLHVSAHGAGRSRRAAEQEAAQKLLAALEASDHPDGPLAR